MTAVAANEATVQAASVTRGRVDELTGIDDVWAFPLDAQLVGRRPATTAAVPRTEDCLVVFRGEDGQLYWHLLAAGNRAVLAQGEGYRRPADAIKGAERACRRAAVVDL